MNSENDKIQFLKALSQLPVIRKHIIAYADQIIQNSNNNEEEKKLIDTTTKNIINDMNINNLSVSGEDIDLLKYGIEMLLNSQLPASKMAAKIRKMKGDLKNWKL